MEAIGHGLLKKLCYNYCTTSYIGWANLFVFGLLTFSLILIQKNYFPTFPMMINIFDPHMSLKPNPDVNQRIIPSQLKDLENNK